MECQYCKENIKDNAIKCKHCGSTLSKEEFIDEIQENETFLKRLFNWKYLLIIFFVSLGVVGQDLSNQNSDFLFSLLFIIPIILAVKSKKKKILLFITSTILYFTMFMGIGLLLIYKDRINTKSWSNEQEKLLDKGVEASKSFGIAECQKELIMQRYSGEEFVQALYGNKEINSDGITTECLIKRSKESQH